MGSHFWHQLSVQPGTHLTFPGNLKFTLFRAVNNLAGEFEGILWFAKTVTRELTLTLTTDSSDMNNGDIHTYQKTAAIKECLLKTSQRYFSDCFL